MKFGLCCGIELAPIAVDAGFDYVEIPAVTFAVPDEFDPSSLSNLPIETSNVFFPGSLKLFEDDHAIDRCLAYAIRAVDRAHQIGIEVMVIGSGATRTTPEGLDQRESEATFVHLASEVQRMATSRGIKIAPESLEKSETNIGNDLRSLSIALAESGVGYTADSFHVITEWIRAGGTGTPPPALWQDQLPSKPAHVHIGDRFRIAPWQHDADLVGFVARLRELGYDERISLESKLSATDIDTLALTRKQLNALFN